MWGREVLAFLVACAVALVLNIVVGFRVLYGISRGRPARPPTESMIWARLVLRVVWLAWTLALLYAPH